MKIKDIPVGGQIEAGMTMSIPVNSNPILLPNTYTMVQKEVIVSESDYIVNAFIFGDTNYNYNGFISVINLSDPHQFQFTVDRIDTDGDTIEDSDYSIDGHYMTITRLIIDNEFDARWLQVQTWGRVQYINFDEWMTGMGPHGFNGIIFMERK